MYVCDITHSTPAEADIQLAGENDVPPSQVRGIVKLSLPRSARIKDIVITFTGSSRTDWPEGLNKNGIGVVEKAEILRLKTSVFRDSKGNPLGLGQKAKAEHAEAYLDRRLSQPQLLLPDEVVAQAREHRKERPTMPPNNRSLRSMRGLLDGLRAGRTSSPSTSSPSSPSHEITSPLDTSSVSSSTVAEWFELRKGEYEYPFSLSLPRDLPPTLHADFGSILYTLKATVFRSGPLSANVAAQKEVTLVQTPDISQSTAADTIVVNRSCEDMLSYHVAIDGHSFPIGTSIPIHLTFMPLSKTKVHRMLFVLEEKIEYFANERKVTRHEMPRKWKLLHLQYTDRSMPLLPLQGEEAETLLQGSPLRPYVENAAAENALEADEIRLAPLNPLGPWRFAMSLPVTMERQKMINISSQHPGSNIHIYHTLKITIRVESLGGYRPDGTQTNTAADPNGKPRVLDIVIGVPITLTHSKTSLEWISLPTYEASQPPADDSPPLFTATAEEPSYIRPPPL